jgi:adenylate cyclase
MSGCSASPYLEVTIGGQARRFPVPAGSTCHIGRDPDCEIPLPDASASRNHAIVQHTHSGDLYLSDLGSRNGTFVNGQLLMAPSLLRRGDVIGIGDHQLVVHKDSAAPLMKSAASRLALPTLLNLRMQMITVLVADIRDYTGLSRRLGEQRISQIIGVFMQEAGAVLQRNGSWAQKYIGDAVMSVWVHPKERVEAAEMRSVLQAARELAGIVESLQARFGLDAPVRIGIGINTGLAATGNMGCSALADYTALGDVVNKAFRLESASKEVGCDIVLGRNTYRSLSLEAGARQMLTSHSVQLKGYDHPEPVYVLEHSAVADLRRALARATVPSPTGMNPSSSQHWAELRYLAARS